MAAGSADGMDKKFKFTVKQQPLLYYPEENHVPSEAACKDYNSRIMKHLMK